MMLQYAAPVWDPHTLNDIQKIEMVQRSSVTTHPTQVSQRVGAEMSTPKTSTPKMSTVPKCLLPKCLLCQNVYSQNVYSQGRIQRTPLDKKYIISRGHFGEHLRITCIFAYNLSRMNAHSLLKACSHHKYSVYLFPYTGSVLILPLGTMITFV